MVLTQFFCEKKPARPFRNIPRIFYLDIESSGMTGLFLKNETRCGPCQRIAPFFEELASRYPRAVFLKVDVDQCPETAAGNGVTAMPTFIFFRNRTKIDRMQGGNPQELEQKVKQHYGSEDADDDTAVQGYVSDAAVLSFLCLSTDSFFLFGSPFGVMKPDHLDGLGKKQG